MKCAFQFFASQQGKAIPLFAVNFLEIYVSSSDSLSFNHPLKPFKTHFFVLILVLDFFDFLELPSTKKKKKTKTKNGELWRTSCMWWALSFSPRPSCVRAQSPPEPTQRFLSFQNKHTHTHWHTLPNTTLNLLMWPLLQWVQ